MTQYIYHARNRSQQPVKGTIEADSRESALDQVMGLGFSPLDIRPIAQDKTSSQRRLTVSFSRQKVGRGQIVFFIRQMSDLTGAGVNVLRALSLTARQTHHPYFKEVISRMAEEVRDGGTLSDAIFRYPRVFPKVYASLIRAGETSGKLGEVLSRLADLSQRDLDARNQIITSLIYPGLILTVGGFTVFALLTWVVPKMTAIFDDLEQALPMATVVLLGLSDFLSRFWLVIFCVLGISGFGLYRFQDTPRGRLWFDGVKLGLPVIGGLTRSVEMGRFARSMATLLGNGVPMLSALEVTSQVMGNMLIRRDVSALIPMVSHGSSLNGALKRFSIFPESVVTMVAVGEESGQIHQGLARMAEYFEDQSQRSMKVITTLVEPVLILGLGLIVGFVVLAMLMPLLQMNLIIQ